MYVEHVTMSAGNRHKKGGLFIVASGQGINLDTYLKIVFEEKDRYFKVEEVDTMNGEIIFTAAETGYYNALYDNKKLDINRLVGLEIEVVTDIETIKKLMRESNFI